MIASNALTQEERDEAHKADPVDYETATQVYGRVMDRLDSRSSKVDRQMGVSLLEDMLLEKSYDLDKFKDKVHSSRGAIKRITDDVVIEGKKFNSS